MVAYETMVCSPVGGVLAPRSKCTYYENYFSNAYQNVKKNLDKKSQVHI
jgi:hypothetical protein